jgi:FtsH-binding integral membrane protein
MPGFATDRIAPSSTETVFFSRVFGWMGLGLAVTGGVAFAIGRDQRALNALFTGKGTVIVIVAFVVEFALVAGLVGLVQHMSLFEAAAVYLGYAALNGLTISCIFAVYTTKSIFSAFLVTAAMFAFLALWGWTTKRDITSWGDLLLGLLFGQIVGLIVNLFWLNSTLYWLTTATGILIFSAYTAYDVQRLKKYEVPGAPNESAVEKASIVGALALYLDFVNLFLYVLRILGRRR